MPVISDLFEWVVTSSLHASILLITILLIQAIFTKWLTPTWRYALWLPLILTFFLPKWDLLPSHYGVSIDSKSAIIQNATQHAFLTQADQADSGLDTRGGAISKPVNGNESASVESYLPLVWFSVSLLFSISVLGSFFLLRRQINLSSRPVSHNLLVRIETLSKSVGLRNPPKVIISPSVKGPAVCGLWRPVLVLSDWFEDVLTEEEQNMILGHELMHISRWDLPINALFYFIVILNWFNPLLWVANYKIGIDREAACDEQVISSSKWNSVEYGKVLINMNSKQNFSGLALGFVGILNNSHSLRYRIQQIASQRQLNSSFNSTLVA